MNTRSTREKSFLSESCRLGMKRVEADATSARSSRTPAAIVCRACNREFFARSLPIHQKTCFQTNAFVELECGKCHSSVR